MWALFKKEIAIFFSSILGYVVIGVFLGILSLLLWVIEGPGNIVEGKYASIDGLFTIAPWVFIFLISLITMKSFAEEKHTGTLELLFTKPISDFQIVFAKYLASLTLFIFAIIPTLIYFISVYQLGAPKGNIDIGSTLGSYIGLTFLGGAFVAIGIFASAITNNQIISVILAVFLCFFAYAGFDLIGSQSFMGPTGLFLQNLGIAEHYNSISKGRIDTRDVVYFISVIAIFLTLTKTTINSRKW